MSRARSSLASSLLVLGLAAIVYWPTSELAVTHSCEPDGVIARAKSFAQGDRFWTGQLEKIDARIQLLDRQPEVIAKAQTQVDAAVQKSNDEMEVIYSKHPGLRPSSSQLASEALREKADASERAEFEAAVSRLRNESIQRLHVCRKVIVERLRQQYGLS